MHPLDLNRNTKPLLGTCHSTMRLLVNRPYGPDRRTGTSGPIAECVLPFHMADTGELNHEFVLFITLFDPWWCAVERIGRASPNRRSKAKG